MTTMLGWLCAVMLLAVSVLVLYQWVLAVAAMLPSRARPRAPGGDRTRFLILVPAHNEEAGLATTLRSLEEIDYPRDRTRIVVVADRCDDGTAALARRCGVECLERSSGPSGKGSAIAWAIDDLRRSGADFDALVITAGGHRFNPVNIVLLIETKMVPATSDPKFANSGYDPGYETTKPGARSVFYSTADADPAVVALDEQLKQTGTRVEAFTGGAYPLRTAHRIAPEEVRSRSATRRIVGDLAALAQGSVRTEVAEFASGVGIRL